MRTVVALLFACLFLAAPALAKDESQVPMKKITPSEFPDLQKYLVHEMRPGMRFGWVTDREQAEVTRELDAMAELLHGHQTLEELSEDERISLMNAQGRVNATLTKRDRDRLICERKKPLGSHRSQTWCETYGERMTRTQGDRDRWDELEIRTLSCKETGFQNSSMSCVGG